MDVTVIIPAYNAEHTITHCVDSILSQTGVDLRIIIVNDGSTDNTLAVCLELADKYPHITVINQQNQGVSAARNAGIRHAHSKYVYFIDSDDELLPNSLYTLISAAEHSQADIIIGNYYNLSKTTGERKKIVSNIEYNKKLYRDYILDNLFYRFYTERTNCLSQIWNKLFRLDLIKQNNITFDTNRTHGEDWAFVIDVLSVTNSIYAVSDCIINYINDGTQGQYIKYKDKLVFSFIDGYKRHHSLLKNGSFKATKIDKIRIECDFFYKVLYIIENQNLSLSKRLLPHKLVRYNLMRITFAPFSLLSAIGMSKRIKIVALLILFGFTNQGVSQFKICK